jgi:hypothetical protein
VPVFERETEYEPEPDVEVAEKALELEPPRFTSAAAVDEEKPLLKEKKAPHTRRTRRVRKPWSLFDPQTW